MGDLHFFGVSHWMFIGVFWWSHVCLFRVYVAFLALGSVQLKEHHWASFLGRQVGPSLCLRGTRTESQAASGWACLPPRPWVGGAVPCLPPPGDRVCSLRSDWGGRDRRVSSPDRCSSRLRGPGASSRGCFKTCSHPRATGLLSARWVYLLGGLRHRSLEGRGWATRTVSESSFGFESVGLPPGTPSASPLVGPWALGLPLDPRAPTQAPLSMDGCGIVVAKGYIWVRDFLFCHLTDDVTSYVRRLSNSSVN